MSRRIDTDKGDDEDPVDLVIFDNSEHGQIDDDERRERRER
jgi:hypothetical protein